MATKKRRGLNPGTKAASRNARARKTTNRNMDEVTFSPAVPVPNAVSEAFDRGVTYARANPPAPKQPKGLGQQLDEIKTLANRLRDEVREANTDVEIANGVFRAACDRRDRKLFEKIEAEKDSIHLAEKLERFLSFRGSPAEFLSAEASARGER